jgi:DNA modification methylase
VRSTPLPKHHNRRLAVGYRPLCELHPNPRDPRIYSAQETKRVTRAIRQFGPLPIVVSAGGVVLSGNIWLEAAKAAGYEEAPVVVADHLTPAEADAFMLANVRLVERGEWDKSKLGEILRDLTLQELDFEIEVTGFDIGEIDLCIEGLGETDEQRDLADELPPKGPAVTCPGDLWLLGDHRLICGDALSPANYRTLMAGELAAITLADPPFNVKIAGNVSGLGAVKHADFIMASGEMSEGEFTAFLIQALDLAAANSLDGSLGFFFMDWRHTHELTLAGRRAYDGLLNICVWAKTNAGMGSLYRSQHELVFVFKKGAAAHRNNVRLGKYGRSRSNVWRYPGANSFGRGGEEGDLLALHPTVKPVTLLVDVLLDASARGDLVLDPFMGVGSTMIAAERVGRRARGIELDPAYVDTAVRRWQRWSGEQAQLEVTGQSFAEVEAERAEDTAHG